MSRVARVSVCSLRGTCKRLVSRCVDYEFEDVICEVDDVELLACEPYRYFNFRQKVVNKIAKYVSVAKLNSGLRSLRLKKDYDLFVMVCMFPSDLLAINAIKGWKESCQTSICWLDEIWHAELNELKGQSIEACIHWVWLMPRVAAKLAFPTGTLVEVRQRNDDQWPDSCFCYQCG